MDVKLIRKTFWFGLSVKLVNRIYVAVITNILKVS